MFGSYGESFLLRMENIDLSKPLTFVPWLMTPEDWYKLTGKSTKNNKSGLTLKQDGEKINPYYDKENPNGMPEFKKKTVKGEVKWDTDDRDDFLFNKFVAFCDKAKNIVVAKPARTVNAPTEALVSAADDFDLDDDDLPF